MDNTIKAIPSIAVVCLGLMGTLFACSGDDATLTTGADASLEAEAAADSAPPIDTGHDVTTGDVTSSDVTSSDSSSVDSTTAEGSTSSDAGHDTGIVSEPDATPEAGDGSTVEDGGDAAAAGPLALCSELDAAYGISTDAGACATATPDSCPDRADNWGNDIMIAFLTLGSGDCRLANLFSAVTDPSTYENQLIAWAEGFFGCPDPSTYDSGAIGFALVPAELSSHPFSKADLNALSQDWVLAAEQSIGPDATNVPGQFTDTQLAEIQARLVQLQGTVTGTTPSTTVYSYGSTCSDSGSDAASE